MLLGSRTATPRRLAWLVFRAPCRSPVPWWVGGLACGCVVV